MKWLVLAFVVFGFAFLAYDQLLSKPGSSGAPALVAEEGDYCGPGLASDPHPPVQAWLGIKTWLTADEAGEGARVPIYRARPVMICNLTTQRLRFDRIELSCEEPGPAAGAAETIYFAGDQEFQVNRANGQPGRIAGTPSVMGVEGGRAMTFDSMDIACALSQMADAPSRVTVALMLGEGLIARSPSVALPVYAALPKTQEIWRADAEIQRGNRGALADFELHR